MIVDRDGGEMQGTKNVQLDVSITPYLRDDVESHLTNLIRRLQEVIEGISIC